MYVSVIPCGGNQIKSKVIGFTIDGSGQRMKLQDIRKLQVWVLLDFYLIFQKENLCISVFESKIYLVYYINHVLDI